MFLQNTLQKKDSWQRQCGGNFANLLHGEGFVARCKSLKIWVFQHNVLQEWGFSGKGKLIGCFFKLGICGAFVNLFVHESFCMRKISWEMQICQIWDVWGKPFVWEV